MDSFQALINIYTPEREREGGVAEVDILVQWHDRDGKDTRWTFGKSAIMKMRR